MSTQFNCQKHFYFKIFKKLYITIQLSVSTVSMSKIVQFKTIYFNMSTQFNCQKHFYFKLFKQLYITIQFSVSTVSMSKIVKTIYFNLKQFSLAKARSLNVSSVLL